MINPKTVSYVRAVADEGSFSKAADKLYISQPSLSANILRAEKTYDVQFFNRNTTPVTLTYAGEIFLREADRIEQLDEQLTRKLSDINNNITGRIVIGESPTMSVKFIPRLFKMFHQKFPDVQLVLREGTSQELIEDVQHGRADLAFTSYGVPVSGLTFMPVINREVFLTHAPEGGEQEGAVKTLSLSQLKGEPFILLAKGREIRNRADALFQKSHFRPKVAYETKSYELSLRMAEAGLGWAFAVNTSEPTSRRGMQYYRVAGIKEIYQVQLIYRTDSYLSKPMQYFMTLSETLGEWY